jgi:hypothetical protein
MFGAFLSMPIAKRACLVNCVRASLPTVRHTFRVRPNKNVPTKNGGIGE